MSIQSTSLGEIKTEKGVKLERFCDSEGEKVPPGELIKRRTVNENDPNNQIMCRIPRLPLTSNPHTAHSLIICL